MPDPQPAKARRIKPPRGTRDLYAAEAARRRWLTERWREVSIRHGFEEVDGPTFEHADLYAVKSGDGILGELFQAFSGKSPEEVEQVKRDGRAPYALRPEFTPTLARMYAAKANTLPKPCKWFMAGPFFRAERPQRGRLREFLQWNCDVLGLDIPQEKWYAEDAESRAEVAEAKARMDAECIACCVVFLQELGLTSEDISIVINDRQLAASLARTAGVLDDQMEYWFAYLDGETKRTEDANRIFLAEHGINADTPERLAEVVSNAQQLRDTGGSASDAMGIDAQDAACHLAVCKYLVEYGISNWCSPFSMSIVRGLAYYTGTVFEVIADGERAVAGGGRYDNLISLFGGPPTPAVGFAMGDVVLSLLLQDKGLMPSDDELLGLAGQHPDVFVLSNGSAEAEARVRPIVAMLRRGTHGSATRATTPGLHVRHSYKATKKIDKLLNEAKKHHARLAVIIEDSHSCVVKDLRTGEQWPQPVALNDLYAKLVAAT